MSFTKRQHFYIPGCLRYNVVTLDPAQHGNLEETSLPTERERERERARERERERQTERERESAREDGRERRRDRETGREGEKERGKHREDTDTDIQTQRHTKTRKDTQTQRHRDLRNKFTATQPEVFPQLRWLKRGQSIQIPYILSRFACIVLLRGTHSRPRRENNRKAINLYCLYRG